MWKLQKYKPSKFEYLQTLNIDSLLAVGNMEEYLLLDAMENRTL